MLLLITQGKKEGIGWEVGESIEEGIRQETGFIPPYNSLSAIR